MVEGLRDSGVPWKCTAFESSTCTLVLSHYCVRTSVSLVQMETTMPPKRSELNVL